MDYITGLRQLSEGQARWCVFGLYPKKPRETTGKYKAVVQKLLDAFLHIKIMDLYYRMMGDGTTRVWITLEKGSGAKALVTLDEANEKLSTVDLGPERRDIVVAYANHESNLYGHWYVDDRSRGLESGRRGVLSKNPAWYEIPVWLKEKSTQWNRDYNKPNSEGFLSTNLFV